MTRAEICRRYRERHPDRVRASQHKYDTGPAGRQRAITKRIAVKRFFQRTKEKVFAAYGNVCVCCGESNFKFLTIDHVNGGGGKDRKKHGQGIWSRILKEGCPNIYRPLCWNCNSGRQYNGGICPHQEFNETRAVWD